MRKPLQCLATIVAMLALCACTSAAPPAPAPADPSTAAPAQPAATAPEERPAAVPVPPSEVPAPAVPAAKAGEPGDVDFSCSVDADCTVKNIGNCCGYYPACVNVDSPTFPEQVQARCEKEGMSSICGFPAIDACVCKAGRCEAGPQNLAAE